MDYISNGFIALGFVGLGCLIIGIIYMILFYFRLMFQAQSALQDSGGNPKNQGSGKD